MDEGALRGLIQLVANKKIVLSEDELSGIIFKVNQLKLRFLKVYSTFTIFDIPFIEI